MTFDGAEMYRLRDFSDRFELHLEQRWDPLTAEVEDKVASIFWVGADARRARHEAVEMVQVPVVQFLHDARQAAILLRWGYAAQQKASSYGG